MTSAARISVSDTRQPSHAAALTITALALAAFAYVTTESLPIGLLIPMSKGLHATEPAIGFLVTAYAAVVVVASVPLTLLTRNLPRRLVLSCVLAAFVVTSLVSATAASYSMLLWARMATALSQALFWALVIPTVAELVPAAARGRVIATVFGGVSLANVAGVPGATWLGQAAGWRMSFVAIGAFAFLALMTTATLLPSAASASDELVSADAPNRHRFWLVVALTVVVTTGSFGAYTYLAPFLSQVTHLGASAVGPVLLVRGAAGVLGVVAAGLLVGRRPSTALTAPVACQAVALLGLFVLGYSAGLATGLVALTGFAFAAFTAALGGRVLELAPGRIDLAAAIISTAVNVGISAGALGGGLLIEAVGVRDTVLAASILSAVGLVLAIDKRPRRVVPATVPQATSHGPALPTLGTSHEA